MIICFPTYSIVCHFRLQSSKGLQCVKSHFTRVILIEKEEKFSTYCRRQQSCNKILLSPCMGLGLCYTTILFRIQDGSRW